MIEEQLVIIEPIMRFIVLVQWYLFVVEVGCSNSKFVSYSCFKHQPTQPEDLLQHQPRKPEDLLQHQPGQPKDLLELQPRQPEDLLELQPRQPKDLLLLQPRQPKDLLLLQPKHFGLGFLVLQFEH